MNFFWWLMTEGDGGVTFTYLQKDPAEISEKATFYNLHDVIDWLPPYTPSPGKLRTLLRCTASYLSRGNVSGPLDAWIEAVAGPDFGAKVGVRTILRAGYSHPKYRKGQRNALCNGLLGGESEIGPGGDSQAGPVQWGLYSGRRSTKPSS